MRDTSPWAYDGTSRGCRHEARGARRAAPRHIGVDSADHLPPHLLRELAPVLNAASPTFRADFARHLERVAPTRPQPLAVAIALACAAEDARERRP